MTRPWYTALTGAPRSVATSTPSHFTPPARVSPNRATSMPAHGPRQLAAQVREGAVGVDGKLLHRLAQFAQQLFQPALLAAAAFPGSARGSGIRPSGSPAPAVRR